MAKLTIQQFELNYPDLTFWVRSALEPIIHTDLLHAIVVAPVKCGKRIMMEYFSVRNNQGTGNNVIHFYFSALNRDDERPQLDELRYDYNFEVYLGYKSANLLAHIKRIESQYDIIYVHLNESDYGTGDTSCMSKIFDQLIAIHKVKIIAYSATNEEAMYSYFGQQQFSRIVHYTPPSAYRGALWFLQNNHVREAQPVWDSKAKSLTQQGIEVLDLHKASNKTFCVFRIPRGMKDVRAQGDFKKEIQRLYQFNVIFSDPSNKFDWERLQNKETDLLIRAKVKTVVVVCQTVSRSTELKIHDEISVWHGAERKSSTCATIMQADGRPIHYDGTYSTPVDIIIYSSIEVFEYYAGLVPISTLTRKLSSRVKTPKKLKVVSGKPVLQPRYNRTQVMFDHLPTIAEYNIAAAKVGGVIRQQIDLRSVYKNKSLNLAEYVLLNKNSKLAGSSQKRHYGTVVSFDHKHPFNWHADWVKASHLHGKFVAIIDIPKTRVAKPVNQFGIEVVKSVYKM